MSAWEGLAGQHFTYNGSELAVPGRRHHVGRRTLQHRHLFGAVGQRRDQRDRRGPAADYHDLLAGVVQVFWPVLRMYDHAAELFDAGEVRGVALVVVVVAAGEEHEPAAVEPARAVVFDRDRPGVGGGIPVCRADVAVELDVAVDAVLVCGGRHVLADVLGVGDAFLAGPRLPRKGQREHTAIGAHPGVAEQIPRAADLCAPLHDGVGQVGVALAEPVGRAEA